jgi:hypothetical protein
MINIYHLLFLSDTSSSPQWRCQNMIQYDQVYEQRPISYYLITQEQKIDVKGRVFVVIF